MAGAGPSATASEFAASEMPVSEAYSEATTPMPNTATGFPPYPPYSVELVCPSLADAILAGRDIRIKHKSMPPKPSRPPPKMARPRGPKATDVKMSRQANRAYARCLRRHNAILTDRLERMSKPVRRNVINFWRENADTLPAATINRLRAMLDADEPFKPDQAYEYFINLKKSKKKKKAKEGVRQIKRGLLATMCADKRFAWARNATVAFARGIRQRLSRPGRYALADGMLRLSNIVMGDLCSYMNMSTPSRRCTYPKAKFMMEMSDKIAVWIDEILCESDDRMLMMDFDEDEDVLQPGGPGGGFADDFLNMMGGGALLKAPSTAYLKFTGPMLQAFNILTDSMKKKGDEPLLEHGKFKQSYSNAADELKAATDFEATDYNTQLAQKVNSDLTDTVAPDTPEALVTPMKEMVDIGSNYLAQHAEYSKDKGKAFHSLVKAMKDKGGQGLYKKGKASKNMAGAAKDLENAKGLESNHDDPNLSQEIHGKLSNVADQAKPQESKTDMAETLDLSSKYLSEKAVDSNERGPAFDHLIKTLQSSGAEPFAPQQAHLQTNHDAAGALKSAPGLSSVVPEPATAPQYQAALHKAVDASTSPAMAPEMNETIAKAGNFLSGYARDRVKALKGLIDMMKQNPTKEAAKRNDYAMNYGEAAKEIETAPTITPYLPVKDIADEIRDKLSADMANKTPPALAQATKSAVDDAAKYLSQPIALRSKAAGERYPQNFLGKIMRAFGKKPLFKKDGYGMSYADAADTLKFAGPLESDPKAEVLAAEISAQINSKVPEKLAPTVGESLKNTGVIEDAAKHLAKTGRAKGKALQHLKNLMRKKGAEEPLAVLQGYEQTYNDGARRLDTAPSLANDKVDKGAYENVSAKLHALDKEAPSEEHKEHMPGIIEDSSKYLSRPFPESEAGKRGVLADMMARKGNEEFDKKNLYNVSYKEAGEELKNAPLGPTSAKDRRKSAQNEEKINSVIPNKKLQEALKTEVKDGAAHLANTVDGRGEALQEIHDALEKEGNKEFMEVGKFKKDNKGVAKMLEDAKHLGEPTIPHPAVKDMAAEKLDQLDVAGSPLAKKYMDETKHLTADYIADAAIKESGLDAKGLANLTEDATGRAGGGGAGGGETEERSDRLEAERRKKLGLPPETAAERSDRLETERRQKLGLPPETDQERAERRKKQGLHPETEEERSDRLEAERRKKLGLPPETGEERADRLEAERRKRAGLPPETDEEKAARRKKQALPGGEGGPGGAGAGGGETEERSDRLEAERRKKLGLPPETAEERADRLEAERRKKLELPPETAEERSDRLETERRQKLGLPPETDQERAERRKKQGLHPETEEERSNRLEAERRKKLGLPRETGAERSDRLEAERRQKLGLPPETDEEKAARRKKQGFSGGGGGPGGAGAGGREEEERSDRLEAERRKKLGLPPETAEERADRLEAERRKRAGLPPETNEEEAARRKKQGFSGGGGGPGGAEAGGGETEKRSNRLEAERRKKLGLPPETAAERSDRLEAERRQKLGLPPETDQERAERRKKQGLHPETEEERSGRLEAERRKKLGLPPETGEERADRLEAERRKRLGLPLETDEERATRRKKHGLLAGGGGPGSSGDDTDREAAMDILHKQLEAKGDEIFYKQPHTELTHRKSSQWLKQKPSTKVDKTVRESGDTSRLSNKFERKLSNLVTKVTPSPMQDTMQDVVIESARKLAEEFVSTNYKTLVKDGLIAEMQKKGNEILFEENGATETCFFAAQRLKKAKSYEASEPCDQTAYYIAKKLDEIVRCRTMARKLSGVMKEHIKVAAAYLSGLVTKPDSDIEAYVALLGEMEVTGDALLIEGDIPKSYKDSAAYLRTLTNYEDQINRSDSSLRSATEAKLEAIMANVPPRGYQSSHMANAISYATKLLVSYIKFQGEKTEALKFLTERLKEGGSGVLLRHGVIRKSYAEGAAILEGKNADQLNVTNAEPVVARKIQIKLVKLVHDGTVPAKFQGLIDDLIEDTTLYLAVNLLRPRVIQVCKCMKNVFVQCELWCDEILRRVARPCCMCSKHVSAAALSDLDPATRLRILPDQSGATAPGLEVTIKNCPSHHHSRCLAKAPTPECPGYFHRTYDVQYSSYEHCRFASPPHRDQAATNFDDYQATTSANYEVTATNHHEIPTSYKTTDLKRMKTLQEGIVGNVNVGYLQFLSDEEKTATVSSFSSGSTPSYHTPPNSKSTPPFSQTTFATIETYDRNHPQTTAQARTPIVSTDQMTDWHAMMVSLMWNVQAWREWIQENIDRTLSYQKKTGPGGAVVAEENWVVFQRRVATEALQWRQYNIFSRQLTLRLTMRYKDKRIVSPTRATNQTSNYMKCQVEMLEIIEMFNRWTQWLTAVVQETNSLSQIPGYDGPMDDLRWKYFKKKVLEYSEDWTKYNSHLKVCWENKYKTQIADWMPAWRQAGPVWVVSACGAVPSGAVSGGLYDNEMIWMARTTHRCNVLPAALHPSKHCCVVYADGGVHHYTKYQVMCNAEAQWRAWRAGGLGAHAVRVAPGTYVGRVLYRGSHLIGAVYTPSYRCHVVIFGRPFAFNCYELLVLKKDESPT